MTIEERMQNILISSPAITAYVPASRIRVSAPGGYQNLTCPYVIHFPIAWDPRHTYDELVPLHRRAYQISVYGDKAGRYSSIAIIRDTIIPEIEGPHADGTTVMFAGGGNPITDENPELIHMPIEFVIETTLT